MMKITGLSHLFKWENLHNWWLTKYFFAPLYIRVGYVHLRVSPFTLNAAPHKQLAFTCTGHLKLHLYIC